MYVPTVEELRDAFAYVVWADRECVAVARSCPPGGFVADQGISFGSVHRVLAHMLGSQTAWLARFHGASLPRLPDHTDYPTLAGLEAAWPPVHADLLAFVDRQTPVALAGPLSYRNTKGDPFSLPLGQALLHVADHATYHRGQLNSLAKRAGGTPRPIMRFTWAAVVADDER